MNSFKRRFIDTTLQDSESSNARRRRFAFFIELIKDLPRPIRILDIGGREQFWKTVGYTSAKDIAVTLINLEPVVATLPNFESVHGDATKLPYHDQSFDIVFSNSTIEHVGGWDAQMNMAKEAVRVGKKYFIQTPNKYFPIEPHLLFPLYQFLPRSIQITLLKSFSLGNYPKVSTNEAAIGVLNGIRLLSMQQMKQLFPQAELYIEKMFGLTKSITAYGGFR